MTQIGFVAADVNRLPFADGSFDVVLCVTVLCHQSIPDPGPRWPNWLGWSRPGGVVCLWEPGVRRLRRCARPGDPLGATVLPQGPEFAARRRRHGRRTSLGCVLVPDPTRLGQGSDRTWSGRERSGSQRRWARRRAPTSRAGGAVAVATRRPSCRPLGVRRRAIGQRRALRNSAVSSAMVAGTA